MHNYIQLENRLIEYSTSIIILFNNKNSSFIIHHLGKQLIRSVTSASLNYGEAQCAESSKDFIHKMRICLKELKESSIALQIIDRLAVMPNEQIKNIIDENEQLIAIFYKSIQTASTNVMKQWKLYKQ